MKSADDRWTAMEIAAWIVGLPCLALVIGLPLYSFATDAELRTDWLRGAPLVALPFLILFAVTALPKRRLPSWHLVGVAIYFILSRSESVGSRIDSEGVVGAFASFWIPVVVVVAGLGALLLISGAVMTLIRPRPTRRNGGASLEPVE
jgi:threonine/homoserine/homoserine lactone efflux protein